MNRSEALETGQTMGVPTLSVPSATGSATIHRASAARVRAILSWPRVLSLSSLVHTGFSALLPTRKERPAVHRRLGKTSVPTAVFLFMFMSALSACWQAPIQGSPGYDGVTNGGDTDPPAYLRSEDPLSIHGLSVGDTVAFYRLASSPSWIGPVVSNQVYVRLVGTGLADIGAGEGVALQHKGHGQGNATIGHGDTSLQLGLGRARTLPGHGNSLRSAGTGQIAALHGTGSGDSAGGEADARLGTGSAGAATHQGHGQAEPLGGHGQSKSSTGSEGLDSLGGQGSHATASGRGSGRPGVGSGTGTSRAGSGGSSVGRGEDSATQATGAGGDAVAQGTGFAGAEQGSRDSISARGLGQGSALELIKTTSTTTLAPGQQIHFRFSLTNKGDETITDLVLFDHLHPALHPVATAGNAFVADTAGSRVIAWRAQAPLAPRETLAFDVVCQSETSQ